MISFIWSAVLVGSVGVCVCVCPSLYHSKSQSQSRSQCNLYSWQMMFMQLTYIKVLFSIERGLGEEAALESFSNNQKPQLKSNNKSLRIGKYKTKSLTKSK